ncbi:hypothetical protein SDC9_106253 [bioreactor metagenome]|uniref:Uncharacterized protein n=1 Tax=bioreactor metagenome TaxID=1076179 RepID=A0A645B4B0_9ZZZZ
MYQNIFNFVSSNAPALIQLFIFASIVNEIKNIVYEQIEFPVSGFGDFVSSIWELIEDHI